MERIFFSESLCKGAKAFDRIAYLQKWIIESSAHDLVLDVLGDKRIGLTFVFLLGTLPLFAQNIGKNLQITVTPKVYRLMSRINILDYYKITNRNTTYNISFSDLTSQPAFKVISNPDDIIPFVQNIQMESPINATEEVWDVLISRIGEIYLNALEHSGSSIVLGGKYFKFQKNKYCFSCYDNGIGIPGNVKTFFHNQGNFEITDIEALKWAMQKGHSTKNTMSVARGLGLDILRSFAIASGGVIRICSGKSMYVLRGKDRESYFQLEHPFVGTLFEMDVFSNSAPVF